MHPQTWSLDPTRILTRRELATVLADAKKTSRFANSRRNLVITRLDPDFRRRIIELRAEFVTRTSAVLTAAGGEFATTLVALVKDTVASAVRLGAARAGLDLGAKLREDVDHERRLQALERRLNGGEAK